MLEMLEGRRLLSNTWFVAPTGLDSNPGSITQPFKTIQRAARLAQPGDVVYLRAGTYHETVTPARSGAYRAPITFTAYANESVAIDGADSISGWVKNNNTYAVYTAAMPYDLGLGNNEIFYDGREMNEAAWPNTPVGAAQPATATITAVYSSAIGTAEGYSDTATISVSDLPGLPGAWNGATIHIGMGQGWTVQTGTVLSSGNGQITYAYQHQTNYETPTVGNHFYLTGVPEALDAAGEWYRDPNTGALSFWAPNNLSPTGHTVEAKHRQFAFELSGLSYINIRNIQIFSSSIDTSPTSSHIAISGIAAGYVSQQMLQPLGWINNAPTTGILLQGNYNSLSNSTIFFSSGNGVYVNGYGTIVQNCTIGNVDYCGADFAGITMVGSHNQLLSNYIYSTGRDGILDSNSNYGLIAGNTLTSIGLQCTDLGAIYDYGTNGAGTIIAYNTISHVHTGGFGGSGVYLDNGSANYVVHDNVITYTDNPIKLNPPSYSNNVYHNTINGTLVINSSSGGGQPGASPVYSSGTHASLLTLGTLGGFKSAANAINNLGQVVGVAQAPVEAPSFIAAYGHVTGINVFGTDWGDADAINSLTQIAGTAYTLSGQHVAYLDTNGQIKNLGTLPGDLSSAATGINDSGAVVGVSYSADAMGNAFIYSKGVMQRIGTLGGSISQAFAINNAGTVVGASTIAGDRDAHAFAWFNGTMTNLGTLGGPSSYALGINKSGVIVGASKTMANVFHAFVYANGHMQDIGTLPGFVNAVATGVNSNGEVVGYAYNGDTKGSHAFLYRYGKMIDLNSVAPASNAGWTLSTATGINDAGQIIGVDTASDVRARAYVMIVK